MEQRRFKVLEEILSDAQVVDVDLSSWDKAMDFYVLADHMPRTKSDRLPLYRITFIGVSRLQLDNTAATSLNLANGEHAQWRIHDFRIQGDSNQAAIEFWGTSPSPKVELTFEDLDIQPVALSTFDELFPGWTRPMSGLARPGPLDMAKQRRARDA
jgi:hypothetical protein